MGAEDRQSIAKEWADALFTLASSRGEAASIGEELGGLVSMIRSNKEMSIFLETPAISREQRVKSLSKVFGGRVSDLLNDFLMVAGKRGRLGILDEIYVCYQKLEDESAGRVRGTLTTATAMDTSEQIRVHEQISRALRKPVVLKDKVDPSILGGMVLNVEGMVMDGSVRRRLERTAEKMRRSGAALRVHE